MRLPALLAAVILVASTGIAAAQSQTPMQQRDKGRQQPLARTPAARPIRAALA
jgi:hypothetical protein